VDVEAYDLNVQGTANGLVQNPLTGDLDGGGNSVTNLAAVEATQAKSPSIPPTRIYKDGTETVAVRDSEISRSTNPATVIQDAIDDIHNNRYENQQQAERGQTRGIVDAGGLEFDISSSIAVKEGVGLTNAHFNASSITSGFAMTIGAPDQTVGREGILTKNISVVNAGDHGVRFRDLDDASISNVFISNATNNGAEFQSCISCVFDSVTLDNCGGSGGQMNDSGDSGRKNNNNLYNQLVTNANGQSGFVGTGGARGNLFVAPLFQNNGVVGYQTNVSATENNTFVTPWGEANSAPAMEVAGTKSAVINPIFFNNDGGGGGNTGIRLNGDRVTLLGPVGGNDDPTFGAGATDCRMFHIDQSPGGTAGSTRPRVNGIGAETANAETPTAADWDPGDVVDFTDSGDGSGTGIYTLSIDGSTWLSI
jgi:hypothetical protein